MLKKLLTILLSLVLVIGIAAHFSIKVDAQSCSGSGFICHYGELQCEFDIFGECIPGTEYWSEQQNMGCQDYPDCGITPDTSICQDWTGTCINVPPDPPPPTTSCGDGTCNGSEDCATCPADCGACSNPDPPPPSDTCTGVCIDGISSCSEYSGYTAASGTCSVGICCQNTYTPPPPAVCNCCDDTDWRNLDGDTPEPGWNTCLTSEHWNTGAYAGLAGECALCSYNACTPSCPVSCGQSDGCGSNCPSTDDGTPSTVDWVIPGSAGETLTSDPTHSDQVRIRWTASTLADIYDLQLYPSDSPSNLNIAHTQTQAASGRLAGTTIAGAFDTSTTTFWSSPNAGAAIIGTDWIGQDFGVGGEYELGTISILQAAVIRAVPNMLVQYSDDGINWTTSEEVTVVTDGTRQVVSLSNQPGKHRYWRLMANSTATNPNRPWTVHDLDFYPVGTAVTPTNVQSAGVLYWFSPTEGAYTARVRPSNTTCGVDTGIWSRPITFYVDTDDDITGSVFIDPDAVLSGGLCTGANTALDGSEGTLTVTALESGTPIQSQSLAGDGSFLFTVTEANDGRYGVSLSGWQSPFICICPAGCSYPSGLNAPQSGVNFYLSAAADAWWQVIGGPVTAQQPTGLAISNAFSSLCQAPTCEPSLILNLNGAGTAGYALVSEAGEVDLDAETAGNQDEPIDENDNNWLAHTAFPSRRENFDYFRRILEIGQNPQSDFGSNGATEELREPSGAPVNSGTVAYFHDGNMTLDQPWDVAADESYIVLVDGDVTVEETTAVAEGGFLAIIASGDITFDPELGHDDAALTTSVVEGVFVADGAIRLPSRGTAAGGDKKFVGEGTFVGWSGFLLERDYDDGGGRVAYNNTQPTDLFRYRPDFVIYAPDEFKRPRYSWRQLP